jgi:aspartate aminotransferase
VVPECIDELCRTDPNRPRLIILNYPANPHGYTYSADELKAIADIARQYKILVLSDEIYAELHFAGQHVSIARYYPEGTIVSGGLSKWCGAGGWRLGTFAFPANLTWLQQAMATVASETYTSTSAPIQYAAVRAFKGGMDIEHYLTQSRRVLSTLAEALVTRLSQAGFDIAPPQGGFYLFLNFAPFTKTLNKAGINNSVDLCEALLSATGVATLPGQAFGRPLRELSMRIAYVDFDGAKALTAAEQVPLTQALDNSFCQTNAYNCVNAIDKLCTWIEGLG